MEKDMLAVWSRACDLAKNDTRFSLISPWMNRLAPRVLERDTLVLVLDDASLAPFLSPDHLRMIGEAVSPAQPMRVALDQPAPARTALPFSGSEAVPNAAMTLDTFRVGISNRLAHASIMAIVDKPGTQYNPVYIHGTSGMGKTHLLHAAWHGIAHKHPQLRVRCVTATAFIAMVEEAAQTRRLDLWRAQWLETTDVLLFDNVHLLAAHAEAENELFLLFNAFYDSSKQLVFTADCPPRRIRNFPERMSSRFHWGLIIELEEMTQEMRLSIIRDRMEAQGVDVPAEVQEFLAQHITTNIRELEGAILKLLGYSSLLDKPITLDIARDVLGEYLEETEHTPTIDDIQKAVCDLLDVSVEALLSPSRAHLVTYPRQIAMFLAREMTSTSLEEIGRRFGGRDHSTVKYGCEKIRELAEKDSRTRNLVRSVRDRVLVVR